VPQVCDRLLVANLGSQLLRDYRTALFVILVLDSLSYTNSNVTINFKRAPASRGGQMLPDSPFKICTGSKRSLTFSIPRAGLDKLVGTKQGQNNKKPINNW
jgi:hypothetical protein